MKLYNTLTRTKDEFKPYNPSQVTMYTCGPTVYHFAHIGNLRSYLMEDVLERYLNYTGLPVKRVMNITDVGHLASDADTGEDKMLKGAKRERKSVMEIAKFYTDAFFDDCEKLNILKPEIVVPATDCVPEFIALVETLIEKGYAYVAGGNVYFDTAKLAKYYVFNDYTEEDLQIGVREGVEEDENKRNKADFVLWFTKSKFEDQELKWDSPWGVGYPGWHIECSAISIKYLGDRLDLHCGGIDNAFPHHTNEIAQSEAAIGHDWCGHWFHVHHLNTNSGKMSKSSGEFLTVSLLTSKGYDPMVYRFFCLQSHYRKSLAFTYEGLDNAVIAYNKLIARIAALDTNAVTSNNDDAGSATLKARFIEAMDNDINTAMAITAVYDVLKADISDVAKLSLLTDFDRVLGLNLITAAKKQREAGSSDEVALPAEVVELVEQRAAARKAKDFALADTLRDQIAELGYKIEETRQGTSVTKA